MKIVLFLITSRKILILLFLILFFPLSIRSDSLYSNYVSIALYEEAGCSDLSYQATWIFPADRCHSYGDPFINPFVNSYNDLNNSINFVFYEDFNCSDYSNETITYEIGECASVENIEEGRVIYANFSISDELPFDETNAEKWVVEDFYDDSNCTVPLPHRLNSFSRAAMRYLTKEEIEGDEFYDMQIEEGGFVIVYCTEESIVDVLLGLHFRGSKNYEFWKLTPRKFEDECMSAVERFYGWDSKMFELGTYSSRRCLTEQEVEDEYLSNLPTKSSDAFEKVEFTYDDECERDYYEIHLVPLDQCVYSNLFVIADYTSENRFFYPQRDCLGEKYMVTTMYLDTIEKDQCYVYQNNTIEDNPDVLFDHVTYYKEHYSPDPYFPTQVALLESYLEEQCTYIAMLKLKAEPGVDAYLSYFNENHCLQLNSYFSEGEQLPYKSIQGKCDAGTLVLTLYTQSFHCLGDYATRRGDICLELAGMGIGVATCIPRECGGISELEEDVCNEHGICVIKDLCDCEEGYFGNLCESWTCYEIDSNDEDVCKGNGECVEYQFCECSSGYSGTDCGSNSLAYAVTLPILGTLFSLTFCLFCFYCFCICCVGIPLCCLLSLCFCSCFCGGSGLTYTQRKKILKFEQLENFDLYLKEQIIEEQEGNVAKLQIDRNLFKIPIDEIKLKGILGKGGSTSTVYLATWSGKDVAFKMFKTTFLLSDSKANQDDFDEFEKEVKKPPRVGIVMEFCENGELLEFVCKYRIRNKEVHYPLREKLRLCIELISSVRYLHSRSIIHRDLKSANVLIDTAECCKLTDFGISRVFDGSSKGGSSVGSGYGGSGSGKAMTKRVGTSSYMAPEVVSGSEYDHMCDSYSFSILLCVLFAETESVYGKTFKGEFFVAQNPLYRPDLDSIFPEYILKGETEEDEDDDAEGLYDGNFYQWLKNVIVRCWDDDPTNRYDFDALMEIFDAKSTKKGEKKVETKVDQKQAIQEEEEESVKKKEKKEEEDDFFNF